VYCDFLLVLHFISTLIYLLTYLIASVNTDKLFHCTLHNFVSDTDMFNKTEIIHS